MLRVSHDYKPMLYVNLVRSHVGASWTQKRPEKTDSGPHAYGEDTT